MKAALCLATLCVLAAAGCGGSDGPDPEPVPSFRECVASDQSFVRQAMLAVVGHRPRSQAEVKVYADLMAAVRARSDADDTADPRDPRDLVVRAMLAEPGVIDRWSEVLMDAVKVARIEDQSQRSCYGARQRADDNGTLAAHVRDNLGSSAGDGLGSFSMLDLVRSAIALDDVSPVYRAHLFALVSRPIPAANVGPVEAELARREDYGTVFDAAYLNRDIVCLGCHNSEGSVTEHPDPAVNRHWPLPGSFERALYGSPVGVAPERAHAPFRFESFVGDTGGGTVSPWDWSPACGLFSADAVPPDIAGVDGLFGNLRGDALTVFDLERALASGFESLAAGGLEIGADGTIDDPDAALAYMVSASVAEAVWTEIIGTRLTISNYFPRNSESRDILFELTERLVANQYSLAELIIAVLTSDFFNRAAPSAGCGAGPYNMPPVFDPWVTGDDDPERRRGGAGDAVVALSARTLIGATYAALEWKRPFFVRFPEQPAEIEICEALFSCAEMAEQCSQDGTCCLSNEYLCANPPGPGEPTGLDSYRFQKGIGAFLKNGQSGFRGLDFQARLVFEDRFGACRNPTSQPDFVSELVDAAGAADAPVGEVVAALKDRLVGSASVSHRSLAGSASEKDAIEGIFGAELTAPTSAVAELEDRTRALCGALLSSPQFLLTGVAPADGAYVPTLTPEAFRYPAVCARVASRDLGGGLVATCSGGILALE